ncbi:GNAT family N-acetyltransferase [Vagococcus sp. BWB3-3]|uniref:GNAT family N-acetyltransferase n=1 Tax=Vagococcus allomyrinae TaxID=2794353 RepID=A0A940SU36_9ENTE|nr:GNAT family N-acetyltransferase [Vagococcus allomyrinae]MBP1040334.1 GNAT family N-acetyltransferase [Vagococcus allomyrinae]
MLTSKTAVPKDYSAILRIWERSVLATHPFLLDEDVVFYQQMIPTFLDQVELRLWFDGPQLVGFSGNTGQELEMLFLEPTFIGSGYGHHILNWLIENQGIKQVDVNEQNVKALSFYQHHGFKVASRSDTDGFNKPYPILHLKK